MAWSRKVWAKGCRAVDQGYLGFEVAERQYFRSGDRIPQITKTLSLNSPNPRPQTLNLNAVICG